jgi:adenylate cyclase
MIQVKNLDRGFLLITILVYNLISSLSNFGVILINSHFILKLILRPEEILIAIRTQEKLQEFSNHLVFISFLIPTIVAFLYYLPIYKYLINSTKFYDPENISRRLLNAPVVSAAVSFIGWGIGIVGFFEVRIQKDYGMESIIKNIVISVIEMILCFSFIFYSVEYYNRAVLIPRLFPEGKLSHIKNVLKVNITHKIFIYYFVVFFVPTITFSVLAWNLIRGNASPDFHWNLIYFVIFISLLSIVITYYLTRSFIKPLLELDNIARSIKEGNYSRKLQILSTDEIGQLGESINEMTNSLIEKEKMKDYFGKVVDPRVRDLFLKGDLNLGGELKYITIMFTDIRGFTTVSESYPPSEIVSWLNQYFQVMDESVRKYEGMINKYIGDAMMVVFGAPLFMEDHAERAIASALEMRENLKQLNQNFALNHLPHLQMGIGIHTGTVLAGNVGSSSRMEYTVVGDAVNIASRIESLCKEYKTDILISEETYRLSQKYPLTFIDEAKIRGKETKIKVYTI